MADFLFVFGYESPAEWRTNREQGTDFESSSAVWIAASDEESAILVAGRSHAERWMHKSFRKQQSIRVHLIQRRVTVETAAGRWQVWFSHAECFRNRLVADPMLDLDPAIF